VKIGIAVVFIRYQQQSYFLSRKIFQINTHLIE